jgi:hypothetical protein
MNVRDTANLSTGSALGSGLEDDLDTIVTLTCRCSGRRELEGDRVVRQAVPLHDVDDVRLQLAQLPPRTALLGQTWQTDLPAGLLTEVLPGQLVEAAL